jgi:hypothetical protein
MTIDDAALLLSEATAIAEGYPNPKNVPWFTKNPGDLELGDLGYGVHGKITRLPSHHEGWLRLYLFWRRVLYNSDTLYNPSMTLLQVAQRYTGMDNAEAWATAAAQHLGIATTDPLSKLLA